MRWCTQMPLPLQFWHRPLPLMLTQAGAIAVLADGPPPLMFTDAAAIAVFATRPLSPVHTDAAALAVFAI